MGLRQTAEADLEYILEDSSTGFGWPVTVTDTAGTSVPLTCYSNDISQIVDPETGQVVSGRSASVTMRISSVYAAGFASLPKGVADSASKPWRVTFDDINGYSHTFKVIQSDPDRTLGLLTCILGAYE